MYTPKIIIFHPPQSVGALRSNTHSHVMSMTPTSGMISHMVRLLMVVLSPSDPAYQSWQHDRSPV